MAEERKTIYLCLAHMSENGMEQKFVADSCIFLALSYRSNYTMLPNRSIEVE